MGSIFDKHFLNYHRYVTPYSDLKDQNFDPQNIDIGDTCLIIFSFHIYERVKESLVSTDKEFQWPYKTTDLQRCITSTGQAFAIHFPSYGSPRVANSLELLSALGIKNVIALGLGGTTQSYIQIGDTVLIEGSIRGDGASRYYVPVEYPAVANFELTSKIRSRFIEKAIKHHIGLSFGTDALYQERNELVNLLRDLKVIAIDLESSAFLAIGRQLGLKCAWTGVISDRLTESHEGIAHSEPVTEQLLNLAKEIIQLIEKGE